MTVDRNIVRRVGKDHGGALLTHQRSEGLKIEGAAAQDAMAPEHPHIPELADRRSRHDLRQDVGRVVILGGQVLERGDPEVAIIKARAWAGVR